MKKKCYHLFFQKKAKNGNWLVNNSNRLLIVNDSKHTQKRSSRSDRPKLKFLILSVKSQ